MYDILIVGGGPAGLTAALYAQRSGKHCLLLEKAGFGGQIAWSPHVENYPGAGSLSGAELAEKMVDQALTQGTDTDIGTVTALRRVKGGWQAETEDGERYKAKAVILAVGAEHRQLKLEGENELVGCGVSYCAVCDGGFYASQDVAVAGGGDSALQEALLLSDICRKVYLIHRRKSFRGEAKLLDRLRERKNVEILTPCRIASLHAEGGVLTAITVEDMENGLTQEIELSAVFAAYGQDPATKDFADVLPLNEAGYVKAGEDCRTGKSGLFVAGDCRKKEVRQLTTAVCDGAVAALAACRYIDEGAEPLEIERKFLIRRPAEETLAEWLLPPSKLYRIVADGVDAGFLRLCFRGGNVAWIEDIFVDPACRGRGYATAAIEEAERIVAADPRYTAVCLDVVPRNQAALHLYHKLGYDRLSLITVRKELRGDRRDRAVRLFEHDFSY